MPKTRKTLTQLVPLYAACGIMMAVGFVLSSHASFASHEVPTYEQCEAQGGRITICHATSSEENPYVEITVACEAMYGNGNAGHFDENGTTQAGHEDDFVPHDGQTCANPTGATPTPSPSASPTPEPSATPEPSTSPSPTPQSSSTPLPSSTPAPVPAAAPANAGRQTSLANDNLQCNNTTFDAIMDVFENSVARENILVRFSYNGSTKEALTNSSGRARVSFDINGNGTVTATADGYPSQSMSITTPFCGNVALDPNKSTGSASSQSGTGIGGGNSTLNVTANQARGQGQVLGATTLADTGRDLEYLTIALIASGLTISCFGLYGILKK